PPITGWCCRRWRATTCCAVTPPREAEPERPPAVPRPPCHASRGIRDSRGCTPRWCDPGGPCRTAAARDIPGSEGHRPPSPFRPAPAPAGSGSLVAERDAPAREVVGRHRERDAGSREHANAEPPHLARDRGEHVV